MLYYVLLRGACLIVTAPAARSHQAMPSRLPPNRSQSTSAPGWLRDCADQGSFGSCAFPVASSQGCSQHSSGCCSSRDMHDSGCAPRRHCDNYHENNHQGLDRAIRQAEHLLAALRRTVIAAPVARSFIASHQDAHARSE